MISMHAFSGLISLLLLFMTIVVPGLSSSVDFVLQCAM